MSLVVDCDFHVLEPADLWQNYLEPEFRGGANATGIALDSDE